MPFNELIILIKLLFGALAVFFSIIVWSKTREVSWIFMVLGILANYVNIVIETLENFGIIAMDIFVILGMPVFKIILVNLPILFYIIGLIAFIIRNRSK